MMFDEYEARTAMNATGVVKLPQTEVYMSEDIDSITEFIKLLMQQMMGKPVDIDTYPLKDGNYRLVRWDRGGDEAFEGYDNKGTVFKVPFNGLEDGVIIPIRTAYLWSPDDNIHPCFFLAEVGKELSLA